jgi:hypothetical protein
MSKPALQALGALPRCGHMLKKILPVLFLPLLLAGCSTPFHSTNLTSLQQPRTTNNLYNLEVAVDSKQQTLVWSSIKPQIVVDHQYYPMNKTLLMSNRWEGVVPVPAGTTSINYRYKFDFQYLSFGPPRPDSYMSPEYTLKIVEAQ